MEKFLKIGEQYVQWIALGLGALYLGLMAWFYVAQPPITVKLDNKELLPGEVDQQIQRVSMQPIIADIKSKTVWADPKSWNEVEKIRVAYVDNPPQVVPTILAPRVIGPTTHPSAVSENPTIVVAPAPLVSPDAPSGGFSFVNIPQAAPAPAANAAAGTAAAAPAALAAPVQPVIAQADRDWLTFSWTIVAKDMDAAFQAAKIPNLPNVYQTAFLRVEVVRQEVLPNGQFGPQFSVPDITTVTLLPMPTENAPPNPDKQDYLAWASANAASILNPPFFSVSSGTPWYVPGTPKPNDVFAVAAVQPGVPPAPVAQPALAPRLPIGVGPPRGVIHGGPAAPAIAPAVAPRGIMPPRPAIAPPPNQPAIAPPAMAPGGFAPGVQPGQPMAGFINPSLVPDITIYTHDWTVEAGHTYRYKMRYTISNPLFGVQQADVKQADRDQLAIKSPYSAWTAPIEIPSHYRFWVQKFQRGSNEVTVDLFTKKPSAPGGLERSTIRVTPGDSIGPSPWLLVDVRPDANRRNTYLFLIADPTGHIERHDLDKDNKDPDHLEMLDRTGGSAAAR